MLQEWALGLVRDGGVFAGVRPSTVPAAERGITIGVVVTHPDGPRLGDPLDRTASASASGELSLFGTRDHRGARVGSTGVVPFSCQATTTPSD
jgi:hypothetical protein